MIAQVASVFYNHHRNSYVYHDHDETIVRCLQLSLKPLFRYPWSIIGPWEVSQVVSKLNRPLTCRCSICCLKIRVLKLGPKDRGTTTEL